MNTYPLVEYRCDCGHLLFKGLVLDSRIDIKCKRCKAVVSVGRNTKKDTQGRYYSIAYNKDLSIVGVSESASDILGYTQDELLRMHARDLVTTDLTSEKAQKRFARVRELAALMLPFHIDGMHKAKDGTTIDTRVRIRTVSEFGANPYVFMYERIPTETEPLKDIPAGSQVYTRFLKVNTEGLLLYISKEAAAFLQVDALDFLGTSITMLISPERRASGKEYFDRMLYLARSFRIKTKALDGEGALKEVDLVFTYTTQDDGHARGYTVLIEG